MSSSDHNRNRDYESGTANVVEMHDAVRREKPLQESGRESLGLFPLVLCALVLIAGGGFFFTNAGDFSSMTVKDRDYTPKWPVGGTDGPEEEEGPWIDTWMKGGKKFYKNCVGCHGADGAGQAGAIPPLKGSEWVNGGTARLGAIMLHGILGDLTVAGKKYNGLMAPWTGNSNEEIAQVLTYIRREFGSLPSEEDGIVTAEMIAAAREKFKDQSGTYSEAGLLAIPESENLPGAKVDPLTGEPK